MAQAEKILRHVGLWDMVVDDPDVIAIRGPPEVELWPPEELPSPEFDAVDEPGADDWDCLRANKCATNAGGSGLAVVAGAERDRSARDGSNSP